MPTILLIDDDPSLLDVLTLALEDAGHRVVTASEGREGLRVLQQHRPSVVISDVNMPVLDGFALLRKLRSEQDPTPVILLTSRDSEIDEALGLELGADDYVAKPFSTRVLLARIDALLRRERLRSTPETPAQTRKQGALELDAERIEVRYRGTQVVVTVTEFRLLEALVQRPGVVRSRTWLMELARGDDSVVAERIIDTYVRRLRRKLESIDAHFDEIETVVGVGYRWREGRS